MKLMPYVVAFAFAIAWGGFGLPGVLGLGIVGLFVTGIVALVATDKKEPVAKPAAQIPADSWRNDPKANLNPDETPAQTAADAASSPGPGDPA